jgi:hypothetical protein
MLVGQKKCFLDFAGDVLPQCQGVDMWNKQLALRPPLRRIGIRYLLECSACELYGKLKRFLITPTAPRVIQDDELNEVMYAQCWGLGGSVIRDQTMSLEVINGILACNGRLD